MGTQQLTYTKQIRNGRLRATEMEMGASVAGTLKGFVDGTYGKLIVVEVMGTDITIMPAGNLKFLSEKVEKGNLSIGQRVVITRTADITTKNGRTATQFDVSSDGVSTVSSASQASSNNDAETIKARIAELRAGNAKA